MGADALPAHRRAAVPADARRHDFYWFSLEETRSAEADAREASYQPPTVEGPSAWEGAFSPSERSVLEMVLPAWLEGRRWLRGRTREISQVRVLDVIPLDSIRFAILHVEFSHGEAEQYVLPIGVESGEKPASPRR